MLHLDIIRDENTHCAIAGTEWLCGSGEAF